MSFYRLDSNGIFSNGTGVGNETASERFMVRKYIVDSVKMWATEYHIDGFRFDLMAVHDVTTMNLLASELELIDPDIFVDNDPAKEFAGIDQQLNKAIEVILDELKTQEKTIPDIPSYPIKTP